MEPYVDRRIKKNDSDVVYGGQIKTAWHGAIRRAGIDPVFTPHHLRHTWATWHYAVHRDPRLLQYAGGWSSLALVERYGKWTPKGHEAAIEAFLNEDAAAALMQG